MPLITAEEIADVVSVRASLRLIAIMGDAIAACGNAPSAIHDEAHL